WSEAQETDRIRIVIRPGQGFGTGHHPTTAGALMAIERLCAKCRYEKALDVGAGSGVLAIALRLFGVKTVAAIDNDPAALENARDNAALNKMTGLRISAARLNSFKRQRFDLISANILSSTLIAMAPALINLLAAAGRLVLGGILKRERADVLARYRKHLRLIDSRLDRGWSTLVLAR
ncbi:MAG: 50S ribosomal protein L11 methyltransferase, partial [Candidatus Binataceae bacterium]